MKGTMEKFLGDSSTTMIRILDLAPIVGNMEQSLESLKECLPDVDEDKLFDSLARLSVYGVIDGSGKFPDCWWFDMDNEILKKYLELTRLIWIQDNRMREILENSVELK